MMRSRVRTLTSLLYLLHGDPFTGKSTALLRIGIELRRYGVAPVLLSAGADRLDPEELFAFFTGQTKPVLMVDDAAPEAAQLRQTLTFFEGQGCSALCCCCGTRADASKRFVTTVGERFVVGYRTSIFVDPTQSFWKAIVERREQQWVRLGVLEDASPRTRSLHFVQHEGSLYSSLASLEDGAGFISRERSPR